MSDQSQLVKDLRELIEAGDVLVLCGTGVSAASTGNAPTATWKGLLHDGVDCCLLQRRPGFDDARAKLVRSLIDSGITSNMIDAASQIEKCLGRPEGEFSRWLRESVGDLKVRDNSLIQAIAGLCAPIATTNYDGLIEAECRLSPIVWQDKAKVERWLRREESGVLHLHGFWEPSDSVVLGNESYQRVRTDPHAIAVLHALRTTKTLLFIGFGAGLQDPNFATFLDWSALTFSASQYRHFRLVSEAEVDAVSAEHAPGERIYPISFGATHADLPGFLAKLRPSSSSAAYASVFAQPRQCLPCPLTLKIAWSTPPKGQPEGLIQSLKHFGVTASLESAGNQADLMISTDATAKVHRVAAINGPSLEIRITKAAPRKLLQRALLGAFLARWHDERPPYVVLGFNGVPFPWTRGDVHILLHAREDNEEEMLERFGPDLEMLTAVLKEVQPKQILVKLAVPPGVAVRIGFEFREVTRLPVLLEESDKQSTPWQLQHENPTFPEPVFVSSGRELADAQEMHIVLLPNPQAQSLLYDQWLDNQPSIAGACHTLMSGERRDLPDEGAVLRWANTLSRLIREGYLSKSGTRKIRLFLGGPVTLAFALGRLLNAVEVVVMDRSARNLPPPRYIERFTLRA